MEWILFIIFVGIIGGLTYPYIQMKRRGKKLHQQYMARLRDSGAEAL